MDDNAPKPPQADELAAEQAPAQHTPEEVAFKLTYIFHQRAKGDLTGDMVRTIGGTAAALGVLFFIPSASTFALVGIAALMAYDVHNGRKRNLMLRDVFNNTTADFSEDLKFQLAPLAEVLKPVEPFGKNDLNIIKNHLAGDTMRIVTSFALGLFAPVMLAAYAAAGLPIADKTVTRNVIKAAMQAGDNLKNKHPDLELKLS